MKENFYENLIKEIEKLISKNKFDKALALINEEINMPYIPMKVEKQLNNFYSQIKSNLKTESQTIGIEKLLSLLKNKKISTEEKFDVVQLLNEVNLNKYIDDLKKILIESNKDINFQVKARILNLLKEQGVNSKIIYKDAKDLKQEVDLTKVELLYDNSYFARESLEIDKYLFKDPIAAEMAFILLENYFYAFFPTYSSEDDKNDDFKGIGLISSLVSLKSLAQKEEFEKLFKASKMTSNQLEVLVNKLIRNIESK